MTIDPATGAWTYTLDAGRSDPLAEARSETEIFVATVSVEFGASDTQQVTIRITGTNDAPVAMDVWGTAHEDGPGVLLTGLFDGIDAADIHTFGVDATGMRGSVIDNGDGTFSCSTNGAFEDLAKDDLSSDSFSCTATDQDGPSSTATANIQDIGQNDAPTAAAETGATIDEGGSVDVAFTPIRDACASGEQVIPQAVNSQRGALRSDAKVSLNTSFSILAALFFGANDSGAGGFAFIIQNQSTSTIGQLGRHLGHAGIADSFAIEFDAYCNGPPPRRADRLERPGQHGDAVS